MQEKFATYA